MLVVKYDLNLVILINSCFNVENFQYRHEVIKDEVN